MRLDLYNRASCYNKSSNFSFCIKITGMERLSDTMFVGFAISPEWDPSLPLDPANLQIDMVYSRQFQQIDSYQPALQRILNIVWEEFALPHVYSFPSRLCRVTPGAGYILNTETRRVMDNSIIMARNLPAPSISGIASFASRHPNILRDVHLLPCAGVSRAPTSTTTPSPSTNTAANISSTRSPTSKSLYSMIKSHDSTHCAVPLPLTMFPHQQSHPIRHRSQMPDLVDSMLTIVV